MNSDNVHPQIVLEWKYKTSWVLLCENGKNRFVEDRSLMDFEGDAENVL